MRRKEIDVGKNYEVTLMATASIVVMDAEDESDAISIAQDYVSSRDYDLDEMRANEIPDDQLESHRRHANQVVEKDD
jgi:hypothetical protein